MMGSGNSRRMLPLLALGALVVGLGCTDGSWINDDGLAVAPGASLLTQHITGFDFVSQGGGLDDVPDPTAACDPAAWTYDVALPSATLAWNVCLVSGTAPAVVYTPASGSRLLADSELVAVRMALGAVRVSGRTACGADKDRRAIVLGTSSGSLTYGDDFYACDMQYLAYADTDALDLLASLLANLAAAADPAGAAVM